MGKVREHPTNIYKLNETVLDMYAQCLGTAYVRQKHRLMQNSLQAASLLPGAAAENNLLQIYLITPLVFGCNMKKHRLGVSLGSPMRKRGKTLRIC